MLGLLGRIEVDLETSKAIDSLREGLQGEIRELRKEMHGEIHGLREELRGEMREMREQLMRHAMVLTESVRDDIRIVADGLATVSAKLDALRR